MATSHQHTPLPVDFTLHSLIRHPVKRRTVAIDTDGGCDDALALLLLLTDPTIDVVAITVTYGNVSLQQATYNVQHLLHVLQRTDIPVYHGAQHALLHNDSHAPIATWAGHGSDGLGDVDWTAQPFNTRALPKHSADSQPTINTEHAASILPKLAKRYAADPHSAGLDLITLGPLTNLALAQRLDPTFISQLHEVHCMAGSATNRGNASYTAEFNAHCDPEALAIVLDSVKDASQLYLYDLDVCEYAGLTWQEFDQLLLVHPGTSNTHLIQHTSEANRKHVSGNGGLFVPCDAYAAAGYLHPAAMIKQSQQVRCCVEVHGTHTRGALAIDWYKTDSNSANVTLVTGYDKQSFFRLLQATTAPDFDQPVKQRNEAMQRILYQLSSSDKLKDHSIYLRMMRPSDAADIAALCSYTFADHEPICKRLSQESTAKRLQVMQFVARVGQAVPHRTADLTSVVAVARNAVTSDEAIIGFAFTYSQSLAQQGPPPTARTAFAPIVQAITDLNADWMAAYRQTPRNLLWFSTLCVDTPYGRLGIGSTMVQAVLELAELHGYDDVACDGTSTSQNCFHACGMRSVNSVAYDDVVYEGERVFEGIPSFSKPYPRPAVHLMHKQLQPKHKHSATRSHAAT